MATDWGGGMARSKRPRKRRAVRHGIQLAQNQIYWLPIHNVILKDCMSAAVAAASTDRMTDRMTDAVIDPIETALTRFAIGKAQFNDYWVVIQGMYLYAHLLTDIIAEQKYRIYDDEGYFPDELNALGVEHHLQPYREQLAKAENEYVHIVREIGERQKRVGKYGMTGDEMRVVRTIIDNLSELTEWIPIASLYRAAHKCCVNLEQIESSLHRKTRCLTTNLTPSTTA